MTFVRRVAGWAWGGAAGVSLLLCAATVALWVRGERVGEAIDVRRVRQPRQVCVHYAFSSGGGVLTFRYLRDYFNRRVTEEEVHEYVGDTVSPAPVAYRRVSPLVGSMYNWPVSRAAVGSGFMYNDAGDFQVGIYQGPADLVYRSRWWSVAAPCWFVALATAAMPAGWAWGVWRGRRRLRAAGLCVACGYDLRASPGRCPECGAEAGAGVGA